MGTYGRAEKVGRPVSSTAPLSLHRHSLIRHPRCLTFELYSGDFPEIFFRGAAPLHPAELREQPRLRKAAGAVLLRDAVNE